MNLGSLILLTLLALWGSFYILLGGFVLFTVAADFFTTCSALAIAFTSLFSLRSVWKEWVKYWERRNR